jgi:hypothetical protein
MRACVRALIVCAASWDAEIWPVDGRVWPWSCGVRHVGMGFYIGRCTVVWTRTAGVWGGVGQFVFRVGTVEKHWLGVIGVETMRGKVS